jgi:hypothetical protein
MTLTAAEVETLLNRIREFRDGERNIEDLQRALGLAAALTQAAEQNSLRDELNWAEGELDSLQFTTSGAEQRAAAMAVVERIENELRPWVST